MERNMALRVAENCLEIRPSGTAYSVMFVGKHGKAYAIRPEWQQAREIHLALIEQLGTILEGWELIQGGKK